MFQHLADYETIFVSGPNRSGTTICAQMIASDTGHDLVLEDEFTCSNLMQLSTFINSGYGPKVIQCPFLAPYVHDLGWLAGADMERSLVVFMHRFRDHIVRSEQNATSPWGAPINFDGESVKSGLHNNSNVHASDAIYECWEEQCQVIPHAIDVSYESLRGHHLWVEDRSGFQFQHKVLHKGIAEDHVNALRALSNI